MAPTDRRAVDVRVELDKEGSGQARHLVHLQVDVAFPIGHRVRWFGCQITAHRRPLSRLRWPPFGAAVSARDCKSMSWSRWRRKSIPFTVRRAPRSVKMGQPGDSMFILSSGRMKVSVPGHDGRPRVLGYLGGGDHFGELALLDAGKRTAEVTAELDSELLALERDGFKQLFDEVPQVAKNLLRALGMRFRGTLAGEHRGLNLRAVALVRACRRAADVLPLVVRELTRRGERVGVLSDRPSSELAPAQAIEPLRAGNGDHAPAAAWKFRVDRLLEGNDRVLVDVDLSAHRPGLAAILHACDENLWLVNASEEADARPAWIALQQSDAVGRGAQPRGVVVGPGGAGRAALASGVDRRAPRLQTSAAGRGCGDNTSSAARLGPAGAASARRLPGAGPRRRRRAWHGPFRRGPGAGPGRHQL